MCPAVTNALAYTTAMLASTVKGLIRQALSRLLKKLSCFKKMRIRALKNNPDFKGFFFNS
jgi:hypothetical protein